MNGEILPVVKKMKLLGTIICDDLKWDENTSFLIKKANSRLLLLRKAAQYTNLIEDLKSIYLSHVRIVLEQSCTIWHSSITQENIDDLERVQKNAFRLILGNKYTDYEESLNYLNLDKLSIRREKLSLKFGLNCAKNPKTIMLFKPRNNVHKQKIRKQNKFEIFKSKTERMERSAVPYLQKLLNKQKFKK